MFPPTFEYEAPTTLREVVALLGTGEGDVKALAGGQSLLPLMKLRLAEPSTLVDLRNVPDLRGIRDQGNRIVIGAMTTYFQVIDSPIVRMRSPLIAAALEQVGDPQVRARGTVGGSLAHADPAGDLPAVALALDATLHLIGREGERDVAAGDFFLDVLTTDLHSDEVVTSVAFVTTDTPHTGVAYQKHRHPASGYAVVGIGAVARLDDAGTYADVRLGVTGAGTHATRASRVEQALKGQPPSAAEAAVNAHALDGIDLMADTYASDEYRGHLTKVLMLRALRQATEAARG